MLAELFTLYDDFHTDRKQMNPLGYRYGNIPPDVNIIEMWIVVAVGIWLNAPQPWLIVFMLIQIAIGLNGMYRDITHKYPHYINWI